MFTLDEKHLDEAKKIAAANRKKKRCDECYDRGWIGVSEENLLVLCPRCVDMEKAVDGWKDYVSQHDELKEQFADLFEDNDEPEVAEPENHPTQQVYDHKKSHPVGRTAYVPGPKRTGRAKKV